MYNLVYFVDFDLPVLIWTSDLCGSDFAIIILEKHFFYNSY